MVAGKEDIYKGVQEKIQDNLSQFPQLLAVIDKDFDTIYKCWPLAKEDEKEIRLISTWKHIGNEELVQEETNQNQEPHGRKVEINRKSGTVKFTRLNHGKRTGIHFILSQDGRKYQS